MKGILVVGILGVVAVVGFFIFTSSDETKESLVLPTPAVDDEEITDFTASFAIFTNGTFRAFTAAMYHNRSKDVFIDSSNSNIIQIKKARTAWDDFFKTLPFTLTKDCLTTGSRETFCTNNTQTLKFYLNGQLDADALDRIIKSGDQLLVSFGSKNDPAIEKQLKQLQSYNRF